jgi:hypothetical protein
VLDIEAARESRWLRITGMFAPGRASLTHAASELELQSIGSVTTDPIDQVIWYPHVCQYSAVQLRMVIMRSAQVCIVSLVAPPCSSIVVRSRFADAQQVRHD